MSSITVPRRTLTHGTLWNVLPQAIRSPLCLCVNLTTAKRPTSIQVRPRAQTPAMARCSRTPRREAVHSLGGGVASASLATGNPHPGRSVFDAELSLYSGPGSRLSALRLLKGCREQLSRRCIKSQTCGGVLSPGRDHWWRSSTGALQRRALQPHQEPQHLPRVWWILDSTDLLDSALRVLKKAINPPTSV